MRITRREGVLVGVLALFSLATVGGTLGLEPSRQAVYPPEAFTSVADTTAPPTSPTPTVALGDWDMQAAGKWLAAELASQTPRPTPTATPTPRPKPRATPKPKPRAAPKPVALRTSHKTTVTATWYCLPGTSRCPRGRSGGLYAAISPDLASLRGKLVRACYRGSCVVVKIIDCLCSRLHGIDLFADAFVKLAPLSKGSLRGVTISW